MTWAPALQMSGVIAIVALFAWVGRPRKRNRRRRGALPAPQASCIVHNVREPQ